jgi:twitching motility two-component system response regulator PilH
MAVHKILVVDDSPTDRQFMTETLAKKGYQVVTADSGESAVEKAKSEKPDLILMDVVMPGLNGYQATRAITRDEASKGADTDKIRGMRQGALDYLVKPVDPQQLLAKIATLN